jgi:hypothetical protein
LIAQIGGERQKIVAGNSKLGDGAPLHRWAIHREQSRAGVLGRLRAMRGPGERYTDFCPWG